MRLARQVDEQWLEQFVQVLRNGGLDGARTGEARAQVESHCADSGRSAEDEFGSPEAYARSLLVAVPPPPRRSWLEGGAGTALLLGLLGMLLSLQTAGSWSTGTVLLTWAAVVTAGVFMTAAVAATHHAAALVRRPWLGVLLLAAAFYAVAAIAVVWEGSLPLQVPRAPAVLLSAALLATSSGWLHLLRPGADVDAGPVAAADVVARSRRRRHAAVVLSLPASTAVLVLTEVATAAAA